MQNRCACCLRRQRSSLNGCINPPLSGGTVGCTLSWLGTYRQIKSSRELIYIHHETQFSQVSWRRFDSTGTLEQTAVTAVYWLCPTNWSRTKSQTACLSGCPTARDPQRNEPPDGAARRAAPPTFHCLNLSEIDFFSVFFFCLSVCLFVCFGAMPPTLPDNYPTSLHWESSATQLPPPEAGVIGKAHLEDVICLNLCPTI